MNKHYLIIALLTFTILSACNRKTIGTSSNVSVKDFKVTPVDFDYLTTSSKIKFDNGDKSFGATANFRIKKDSIIWVSITPGLGIEVARALITRDSVKYMNRMDKEYDQYSFQDLSNMLNFDMSFDLLQSVLLGDIPLGVRPEDEVSKKGNYFVVTQEDKNLLIENFVGTQSGKLERVAIVEQGKGKAKKQQNTLNLSYADFQEVGHQRVPFKSDVSLDYERSGQKKRTEVNIQHKRASFEDEVLRFPFSIPDKYVQH